MIASLLAAMGSSVTELDSLPHASFIFVAGCAMAQRLGALFNQEMLNEFVV